MFDSLTMLTSPPTSMLVMSVPPQATMISSVATTPVGPGGSLSISIASAQKGTRSYTQAIHAPHPVDCVIQRYRRARC